MIMDLHLVRPWAPHVMDRPLGAAGVWDNGRFLCPPRFGALGKRRAKRGFESVIMDEWMTGVRLKMWF